jgi:hypothetical protein
MRFAAVQQALRVHRFVDRQPPPVYGQRRAQQVPAPIGFEFAPVHDQDGMVRADQQGGGHLVHPASNRMHVGIAQQPIQALERRCHAHRTRPVPRQFHHDQAPSRQTGLDGGQQVAGIARVQQRQRCTEQLLQYSLGVHDESLHLGGYEGKNSSCTRRFSADYKTTR